MPFWKRGQPQPDAPAAIPVEPQPPPVLRGSQPCSATGCPNHDAVQCAYLDRRRQPCPTAWCPAHQLVVAGACYCRRHAGLPRAVTLGEFEAERGLPDTGNRCPSLVMYVSQALEPRLLHLLNGLLRPGTADQVGTEPVHPVRPAAGGRLWTRSWQIHNHLGVIVKVAVEVDEVHDPEVMVRVGSHVVVKEVPPWIQRRSLGLPALSNEEDGAERERFYASVFERLEPAVVAEVRSAA